MFGINYLDQDRLTWGEFLAFTAAADRYRQQVEKDARKISRGAR